MKETVKCEIGSKELVIESGQIARQASGAVLVKYGETVVLVTTVTDIKKREGIDFLPLAVDYQEMSYAAGRIPGSFFRREIGRPSEKETLTSRLIDRPVRPLFPEGYRNETQIIATVLSVDSENEPDILAMTGASAALHISQAPFAGPIAGVRVGRIDGKFMINPTFSEMEKTDINLVVAGSREGIVMVEGGATFVSEEDLIDAIFFGYEAILPLLDIQDILREKLGKDKMQVEEAAPAKELEAAIKEIAYDSLDQIMRIPVKLERYAEKRKLKEEVIGALEEKEFFDPSAADRILHDIEREVVRKMVIEEKRRIDGRGFDEIRPIRCEVGLLPRTHGSSLFQRGETQVMAITTLGSSGDEQKVEALAGETFKSFMLHYNFPPYCVGEVKMLRGPSRREIGHGALAERALKPVVPNSDEFPYTIRVVSEVMESNGSSSMATVCGGSLSLMDAGVPIKKQVAGIAMGLMIEKGEIAILSDILGDEDHLGDMDFKVTGTEEGITALQMDIKIAGITREVLQKALEQAKKGRLFILDKMNEVLSAPRPELSKYAPRIITMQINPEKIRDVIGPGGKMVRSIISETNTKIDIEDNGKITIMSPDLEGCRKAMDMIKKVAAEAEVGEIYLAKITRITDYGAFAEILPHTEGLIHISQLENRRVRRVSDVVKEGDRVLVKVIDIDKDGRIRLSRKAALGARKEDIKN